MFNPKNGVPAEGYTVNNEYAGYRATAIALMERWNVAEATHKNGKTYTLDELKKARLGYDNKTNIN